MPNQVSNSHLQSRYADTPTFLESNGNGNGKVTVVTRTKDRPLLLRRAIQSVTSQLYKNWEMIIVNDGGEKEPVENIIEELPCSDKSKITILHHDKNKGMEAATNSGLKAASGEYFVIHDDDDSWDIGFLSATTTYLQKTINRRYAAVTTNCLIIHEEIDRVSIQELSREPWILWSDTVSLYDMLVRNTIPTIALVVRKSTLEHLKSYNDQLQVLGDWDFNIRLLLLGDIGTINSTLAYYHQRQSASSADMNSIYSGINIHNEHWNRYRNSLIRTASAENPSSIGIINSILTRLDEIESKSLHRAQEKQNELLDHIQIKQNELLDHIQISQHSMLQSLQRLEKYLIDANAEHDRYVSSEFSSLKSKVERSSLFSLVIHRANRILRRLSQ